jgi:hypothetical protein
VHDQYYIVRGDEQLVALDALPNVEIHILDPVAYRGHGALRRAEAEAQAAVAAADRPGIVIRLAAAPGCDMAVQYNIGPLTFGAKQW